MAASVAVYGLFTEAAVVSTPPALMVSDPGGMMALLLLHPGSSEATATEAVPVKTRRRESLESGRIGLIGVPSCMNLLFLSNCVSAIIASNTQP